MPRERIAAWLAVLPVGESRAKETAGEIATGNPFAETPVSPSAEPQPDLALNPFLPERPQPGPSNPFADTERERKRREMLRRLRGEET